MDERLEKALEFSNFLETQNNQKSIFLKQYYDNLVHYVDGHKISVTTDLISFCQSMLALEQDETIFPLDCNNKSLDALTKEVSERILDANI